MPSRWSTGSASRFIAEAGVTVRLVAIATAAFWAVVAFAPSGARAFERTRGEVPDTYLFWRYREVEVRAAYDSSADLPPARVELAVTLSLAAWNDAAAGCSDLLVVDGGPPLGLDTNLVNGDHDGENRIVWREDSWPAELSEAVLAQTTLVYDARTGELLDADIDLNGVHHFWTDTEEAGRVDTDVRNTVTHELGHVIGLAHTPDPEATMFAESAPGDLAKRTLAADDIDGLCFVYPDGLVTPSAPNRRGASLTGCAVSSAPSGSSPMWIALLFALVWGRRMRSRAPARSS